MYFWVANIISHQTGGHSIDRVNFDLIQEIDLKLGQVLFCMWELFHKTSVEVTLSSESIEHCV